MAAIVLDGTKIAKKIKKEIKIEVEALKKKKVYPRLDVVLVGNDPASEIYVKHKKRDCEEVGIISKIHRLQETIVEKELVSLIERLNYDETVSGILVQLPLPRHINEDSIINTILPQKDVDGFCDINIGRLVRGADTFSPCTPAGIINLLREYKIGVEGKNAVVIGRSNIVGKPMMTMLLNNNTTVTICHSKTEDIIRITRAADIIVCAVGVPMFLKKEMVKEGAVVIDVGINKQKSGRLVGDVDYEEISKIAGFITPVPGGVGPMTRASLLSNTLLTCIDKRKN